MAIVAATPAIVSAVACTRPWPIALEPTARSSPISPAGGIVAVAAPGMPGSWSKPKRRATSTSRSAPTSAPRGANTELHDRAKAWTSVPPQYSPLSLSSSTPSSVADVVTGYSLSGRVLPSSSAAVAVMILKVDPGGCSPLNAMPAAARISPLRGFIATTPPRRPASASTAACWTCSEIVVRTASAACGGWVPSSRSPASSTPPGRPRTWSSKIRSRPLTPTCASAGTPWARSRRFSSSGIAPSSPTIDEATGSTACPSGARTSGLRSRDSSAARSGSSVRRVSFSPGRRPGNTRSGVQLMRASPSISVTGRRSVCLTVPKATVSIMAGTSMVESPASRAGPNRTRVAVAVVSASR